MRVFAEPLGSRHLGNIPEWGSRPLMQPADADMHVAKARWRRSCSGIVHHFLSQARHHVRKHTGSESMSYLTQRAGTTTELGWSGALGGLTLCDPEKWKCPPARASPRIEPWLTGHRPEALTGQPTSPTDGSFADTDCRHPTCSFGHKPSPGRRVVKLTSFVHHARR